MLQLRTVLGLLLLFLVVGFVYSASAQTNDVYSVAYYVGGATGSTPPTFDGKVQIVYPGAGATAYGQYTCADIYVFDPGQELKECCSCLISTDGLLTIPLHSLTDNPANGLFSPTGVIKIVSDTTGRSGACPLPMNPSPGAELRSWIVNLDASVTEVPFKETPLSSQELLRLGMLCSGVPNESGPGVCRCS